MIMKIDPNAKFRPTLSTIQILTILELAKTPPISEEKMSIISTLAPILAKIQTGAMKPAYTSKAAKTPEQLLEELGGSTNDINLGASRAHYWKQCYNKWIINPDDCTHLENEGAKEHRYLNDLMTPEEITSMEAIENYNITGNKTEG